MNTPDDYKIIFLTGEQIEAICLLVIGIISTALALIFLGLIKYSFHKGLSYPFLVMGIFGITQGSKTLLSIQTSFLHLNDPNDNLAHLNLQIEHFLLYRWIEAAVLLAGLFLYFYFYKSKQQFWKGVGLGMIIQMLVWISFNEIALYRFKEYIGQIPYP